MCFYIFYSYIQLNAMRKQAKPVSGHITSRRAGPRPANLQLQFQQQHQSSNNNLNETFVVDERTTSAAKHAVTPTGKGLPATRRMGGAASPARGIRSPAVSKKAKQKWEVLDRKVCRTLTVPFFITILFVKTSFFISERTA